MRNPLSPKPQAPDLELYEVRGGAVHALDPCGHDPEAFMATTGHAYPLGHEVVHVHGARVAFYTKGVVRAWPLGGLFAARPGEFTQEDVKSAFGSYMVYMLRKALTPEEQGWPKWAIMLVIGVGLVLALTGVTAYFSYQAHDTLQGLLP